MDFREKFGTLAGRTVIVISVVVSSLSTLQLGLIIFLIAFIADFFTGWLASYMEIKNGLKTMPKSGYSLESRKARESITKGIGYMLIILGSAAMEHVFFDRKFNFASVTSKSFGVTELIVGFCFAIEAYSVIFENLKRAGFDLVGKVSTLADTVWSVIKKVKGK